MRLTFADERVDYWLTSDYHLDHYNIIRFCNRPFTTVEKMNSCLIDNCNQYVKETDVLFYLGDWCAWKSKRGYAKAAKQFRGKIRCHTVYFVWGNHDKKGRGSLEFENLWAGTDEKLIVNILGRDATFDHYANLVWDKSHYGAIHCYGHSHASLPEADNLSMDVGVDMAARFFAKNGILIPDNYRPFNWMLDVVPYMATKKFVPIDHHK